MASPTVFSSALSQQTTSVTTSNVTMPASVAAGDLLIAFIGSDTNALSFTWPAGWVEILDVEGQGMSASVGYKIAAGGETTVAVTHGSERSNHIALRIKAAEWHGTTPPEIGGLEQSGGSANPDSGSLTPSWGAADNLWISFFCADQSSDPFPVTAWPTNYTGSNVSNNTATSAGVIALATRGLNATSEDPGAFTMTGSESWAAWTLAVRPAAGGTNVNVTGVPAIALGDGLVPSPDLAVSPAGALALGDAPVADPVISVTALALAVGDAPVPEPSISVAPAAAFSLGDAPVPIPEISVTALALALGDAPIPTIVKTGNANITAVPAIAAGRGNAPVPSLSIIPYEVRSGSINTTFEVNTANWTLLSGTTSLTRVADPHEGSWSGEVITTLTNQGITTSGASIVAKLGETMVFEAWVKGTPAASTWRVAITEHNSVGTYLGVSTFSGTYTMDGVNWQKVRVSRTLTHADVARIGISFRSLSTGSQTGYIDDVLAYAEIPSRSTGSVPLPIPGISVTALALALGVGPTPVPEISVTALALALGVAPIPAVSVGGPVDATITAVPAVASGVSPVPAVEISVSPAAAVALGDAPVPDPAISVIPSAALALADGPLPVAEISVSPAAALSLGAAPVPALSVTQDATVTAVPAIALGAALAPVIQTASVTEIETPAAVAIGRSDLSLASVTVGPLAAIAAAMVAAPVIDIFNPNVAITAVVAVAVGDAPVSEPSISVTAYARAAGRGNVPTIFGTKNPTVVAVVALASFHVHSPTTRISFACILDANDLALTAETLTVVGLNAESLTALPLGPETLTAEPNGDLVLTPLTIDPL